MGLRTGGQHTLPDSFDPAGGTQELPSIHKAVLGNYALAADTLLDKNEWRNGIRGSSYGSEN